MQQIHVLGGNGPGARLARMYEKPEYADKWQTLADQIHSEICSRGVDERGVFVQTYGSTALDASLLLMPLLRFLPRKTRASELPC